MFITGVGTISDLRAWLAPCVSICVRCHAGEILSCVVCPPASTIIMSATLQIHFLCWRVTKENQIILKCECSHQLQAIIVKTEPLYVGPLQAMFGDYVVAS